MRILLYLLVWIFPLQSVAGPPYLRDPLAALEAQFLTYTTAQRIETEQPLPEGHVRIQLGTQMYAIPLEQAYRLRGRDAYNVPLQESVGGSHRVVTLGDLFVKDLEGLTDVNPVIEHAIYSFYGLLLGRSDLIAPSFCCRLLSLPVYEPTDEPTRAFHNRAETSGNFRELMQLRATTGDALLKYAKTECTETLSVSAGVPGVLLADHQSSDYSPPTSFSAQAHLLLSYLTQGTDTHGGNFILRPDGTLVGIDNDMAFAQGVFRKTADGYSLDLRDDLWHLAAWEQPLDQTLQECLKQLDPQVFLMRWLSMLSNSKMRELYPEATLSSRLLVDITMKVGKLKQILGGPPLRFKEMLQRLDPVYYHAVEGVRSWRRTNPDRKLPLLHEMCDLQVMLDVGEHEPEPCSLEHALGKYVIPHYDDIQPLNALLEGLAREEETLVHVAQTVADDNEGRALLLTLTESIPSAEISWNRVFETLLDRVIKGEAFPECLKVLTPSIERLENQELLIECVSTRGAPYRELLKPLETHNRRFKFANMLEALLPQVSQAEAQLIGARSGPRRIREDLCRQLFEEDGSFIRRNDPTQGRRDVGFIEDAGYRLYVKLLPEIPGIEEQVGKLCHTLFGRGTPQVELFRLRGGRYDGCPVLISEGIEGPLLRTLSDEMPEALAELDPEQCTELILLTLLINPEDGNRANYIVEARTRHLIALDNDRSFVPDVDRDPVSKKVRVQVKTAVFCLDQMRAPLAQRVIERYCSLNIPDLLQGWLDHMEGVLTAYDTLYNTPQELWDLVDKHHVMIGVPYRKGGILDLHRRMMELQDFLSTCTNPPTGFEALKALSPFVYKRYWACCQLPSLKERFHQVENGVENSVSATSQVLGAQGIPLHKDMFQMASRDARNPAQAREDLHVALEAGKRLALAQQDISKVLQYLREAPARDVEATVRHVKFNQLDSRSQAALIDVLSSRPDLHRLAFDHVAILNAEGAPLPDALLVAVQEMGLSYARGLDYLFLDRLCRLSQQTPGGIMLTHLDLSHVATLRNVCFWYTLATNQALEFPHLQELKVSHCERLREIRVKSPMLTRVIASQNPQLSLVDLEAGEALEKIHLNRCPALMGNIHVVGRGPVSLEIHKNPWIDFAVLVKLRQRNPCLSLDVFAHALFEVRKNEYRKTQLMEPIKILRVQPQYFRGRQMGDAGVETGSTSFGKIARVQEEDLLLQKAGMREQHEENLVREWIEAFMQLKQKEEKRRLEEVVEMREEAWMREWSKYMGARAGGGPGAEGHDAGARDLGTEAWGSSEAPGGSKSDVERSRNTAGEVADVALLLERVKVLLIREREESLARMQQEQKEVRRHLEEDLMVEEAWMAWMREQNLIREREEALARMQQKEERRRLEEVVEMREEASVREWSKSMGVEEGQAFGGDRLGTRGIWVFLGFSELARMQQAQLKLMRKLPPLTVLQEQRRRAMGWLPMARIARLVPQGSLLTDYQMKPELARLLLRARFGPRLEGNAGPNAES